MYPYSLPYIYIYILNILLVYVGVCRRKGEVCKTHSEFRLQQCHHFLFVDFQFSFHIFLVIYLFLFMFLNINIFTKISFIIFYISIHKRMCARLTQLFAPSASCNGGHFPDINHQILLCFSKEEMWKIWEGWLYSMEIFIPLS